MGKKVEKGRLNVLLISLRGRFFSSSVSPEFLQLPEPFRVYVLSYVGDKRLSRLS